MKSWAGPGNEANGSSALRQVQFHSHSGCVHVCEGGGRGDSGMWPDGVSVYVRGMWVCGQMMCMYVCEGVCGHTVCVCEDDDVGVW